MEISQDVAAVLQSRNPQPPSRLGRRYTATSFLPEAGNTVVCHLDPSHPDTAAILSARERLKALPGAEALLFTPSQSLHMTVFDGVIETGRPSVTWPEGLARDAAVPVATAAMLNCLDGFDAPAPFAVRVSGVYPGGLWLEGASAADEACLRDWRNALADCFGLRHRDHETYRLHMTFAYYVSWLPDELASVWSTAMADILADLRASLPKVPLGPPAFCTFADMTYFDQIRVLQR